MYLLPGSKSMGSGRWADEYLLQSHSVFTCGEDGFVRAWKPEGEGAAQAEEAAKGSRKEKKNRDKGRFKPY